MEFVRIEVPANDDNIYIVIQERHYGTVTDQMLAAMREEVWTGGDTWECGDFGNIPDRLNTGGRIQITLSDFYSDWVPPLLHPAMTPRCTPLPPSGITVSQPMDDVGALLVSAVFVLVVLFRMCSPARDDEVVSADEDDESSLPDDMPPID